VEQDYNVTGATFTITAGNDDNHFLIDVASRNLKVGSQPLDRELKKEYQLRIQLVKDGIVRGVAMVKALFKMIKKSLSSQPYSILLSTRNHTQQPLTKCTHGRLGNEWCQVNFVAR
jgi:hypothetical protein